MVSYIGLNCSNRLPFPKENVFLVVERLVCALLIFSNEAVDVIQNLLLINLLINMIKYKNKSKWHSSLALLFECLQSKSLQEDGEQQNAEDNDEQSYRLLVDVVQGKVVEYLQIFILG